MNPQALSSALTSLRTLWPRALGYINTIDTSVSVSGHITADILPANSLVQGSLRLAPKTMYTNHRKTWCVIAVTLQQMSEGGNVNSLYDSNQTGSLSSLFYSVVFQVACHEGRLK